MEFVKISTDPLFVHEANPDDELPRKRLAMNQTADQSVYDQTYHNCLEKLKNQPLKDKADVLGVAIEDDFGCALSIGDYPSA